MIWQTGYDESTRVSNLHSVDNESRVRPIYQSDNRVLLISAGQSGPGDGGYTLTADSETLSENLTEDCLCTFRLFF